MEVIFDNIIAAEDDHEQNEIMRKLLQRARDKNVKFNPAKLQYNVSEVKYMGNIVSESGLKLHAEKVQAIIQMPPPQKKQRRAASILGNGELFFSVYSQSVRNHCTFTKFAEERRGMELVPGTYTGS